MTLAHLGTRTTGDLQLFASRNAADDSLLYVDDPKSVDQFAIEFTVGQGWSEHYGVNDVNMFAIHEKAGVRLAGLGSIVVETRQTIQVPLNMYGIVVPTGSLFLERGIILAAAKIEPAFEGKLRLRLMNTTARDVWLKAGDKLASGIFISTQTTARPLAVRRESRIIDRGPDWRFVTRSWVGENYKTLIQWFVTAAFGAVAAKWLL